MTGTAWQCIGCGPAEVTPDRGDVPERLAQLLEEEYKRVVWGMINPGSDAVAPTVQSPSRPSRLPSEFSSGLRAISQKRAEIGRGFYARTINRLGFVWLVALAILGVTGSCFGTSLTWPMPALFWVIPAIILVVIGFVIVGLMIGSRVLGSIRRGLRLRELNQRSAHAPLPLLNIEPRPMDASVKGAGTPDSNKSAEDQSI
jgi:hypothetical protein